MDVPERIPQVVVMILGEIVMVDDRGTVGFARLRLAVAVASACGGGHRLEESGNAGAVAQPAWAGTAHSDKVLAPIRVRSNASILGVGVASPRSDVAIADGVPGWGLQHIAADAA